MPGSDGRWWSGFGMADTAGGARVGTAAAGARHAPHEGGGEPLRPGVRLERVQRIFYGAASSTRFGKLRPACGTRSTSPVGRCCGRILKAQAALT